MKSTNERAGHAAAMLTILIWGGTFISTKVLLRSISPVEILFTRFLIGFVALLIIYPKRLIIQDRRQECLFVAAGFCGITLYYLLENIALTLTTASNVGIIITIAPFFTAILSRIFLKSEKPAMQFYIGFLAAIVGVALISYNGSTMQLNPKGDLLAVLAAVTWAAYSILTRKISGLGYRTVQTTRRIFFYGLLLILPMLFFMDFRLGLERYAEAANLGNILFLGLGASALCFVTWNTAVGLLGAVKTSAYIYLVPIITVAASVLILHEPLTPILIVGALLTLLGLWLSEGKFKRG
ncbi:MAG: DMT family transporter [Deferribacteraceae bacterium]|jgi:drug/metabolite transporter (DMT)-like permease|nr:DMT family transporter [Deferribacteraceae bacterium]